MLARSVEELNREKGKAIAALLMEFLLERGVGFRYQKRRRGAYTSERWGLHTDARASYVEALFGLPLASLRPMVFSLEKWRVVDNKEEHTLGRGKPPCV